MSLLSRIRLRVLFLLIATRIDAQVSITRPCFETRGWYSADPSDLIVGALPATTSLACQEHCLGNEACNIWTWRNNLHATASLQCDLFAGQPIFLLDDVTRSGCYESPCRDCAPPPPILLTLPPANASVSTPPPEGENEAGIPTAGAITAATSTTLLAGVVVGAVVCAVTFAAFAYRRYYVAHKDDMATMRRSTVRVEDDGFAIAAEDDEEASSLAAEDEGPAPISEYSVSESAVRPTMPRVRRKNSMSLSTSATSYAIPSRSYVPEEEESEEFDNDVAVASYSSSSDESHIELTVRPTPPRSFFERSTSTSTPKHSRSTSVTPKSAASGAAHRRTRSTFSLTGSPQNYSTHSSRGPRSELSLSHTRRSASKHTSPPHSGNIRSTPTTSSVGTDLKRNTSTLSLTRSPVRSLSPDMTSSRLSVTTPRSGLALTQTQHRRMFGSRGKSNKSMSPQRKRKPSIKSIFSGRHTRDASVSSIASSQFLARHMEDSPELSSSEAATSSVPRRPLESPRGVRPRSGSFHRRAVSQPPPQSESSVVVFDPRSGYSSPKVLPADEPLSISLDILPPLEDDSGARSPMTETLIVVTPPTPSGALAPTRTLPPAPAAVQAQAQALAPTRTLPPPPENDVPATSSSSSSKNLVSSLMPTRTLPPLPNEDLNSATFSAVSPKPVQGSLMPTRTLPPVPDEAQTSGMASATATSPKPTRSDLMPTRTLPPPPVETKSSAVSSTSSRTSAQRPMIPSAFSRVSKEEYEDVDDEHVENTYQSSTTPSAFSRPIKHKEEPDMPPSRSGRSPFAMSLTGSTTVTDNMSLTSAMTSSPYMATPKRPRGRRGLEGARSPPPSRMDTSSSFMSSRASVFSHLERVRARASASSMSEGVGSRSAHLERVMTSSEEAAERTSRLARVLFNKYRGGNASLSRDDFGRFVSDLGYAVDDDELESTFDSIDANRSGGVEFEEFRDWCSPDNMGIALTRETLSAKELHAAFDAFQRFDKDVNGQIDREEFDSLYKDLVANDMTVEPKESIWRALAASPSSGGGRGSCIRFSSYVRWLVDKRMYHDETVSI